MPQPAHDNGFRNGQSLEGAAQPAAAAGEPTFDAVLQATLAADLERVTAEEIAALRAVAARHLGQPLTLQPVAVELVAAMIQVNYGGLKRPPEVWQATAEKIATVIFESPAGRQRLDNLWRRLSESDGRDA